MFTELTIAAFVLTFCVLGLGSALVIHYFLSAPINAVPGGRQTIKVALNTGSFPQDLDLNLWRAALERYRAINRYAIGFAGVTVASLLVFTGMTVEIDALAFQGVLWGTLLCIVLFEGGKLHRLEQAFEVEETFAELYASEEV